MENWTLSWSKLLRLATEQINNIDKNIEGVYRLSKKEGDKNELPRSKLRGINSVE
jgi:hypothetical protein